jgi:LuxR family maltose regulon positive regulatory protein
MVAAPAGSGKTVLLRSWIGQAGLAKRTAWVPLGRDERDPQRFWLSVVGALRQTVPGSGLVRELTAAPDLDGWAMVERLLMDLAPLADRLWLVIDDLHERGSERARRQLELLLMRAPEQLRLVLATRHDVRLGLHRLRLEGELTEIRAGDLRFTVAEAGALFAAAGVQLPGPTLEMLSATQPPPLPRQTSRRSSFSVDQQPSPATPCSMRFVPRWLGPNRSRPVIVYCHACIEGWSHQGPS